MTFQLPIVVVSNFYRTPGEFCWRKEICLGLDDIIIVHTNNNLTLFRTYFNFD